MSAPKPEFSIAHEVEINAPPDAVWKALTDADELTRWFPLQARVTPGVGGKVWASWGGKWEGEGTIEIWEPGQHLRLVSPAMAGTGVVATDYILEARGGRTLLRVVQSGFHSGADWNQEFVDATRRGWEFELRGLRHYLEHHRGTPRSIVRVSTRFEMPVSEAWARLMSPAGLGHLESAREFDRYALTAATGDRLSGLVYVFNPPRDFGATVDALNNAYLRLRLDEMFGNREAHLWVSAYGVPQPELDAFENRWTELMNGLRA